MTKKILFINILLSLFSITFSFSQTARLFDANGILIQEWRHNVDGLKNAINEVTSRDVEGDSIHISGVFTKAYKYSFASNITYKITGDGIGRTVIQPYDDGVTAYESSFMSIAAGANVYFKDLSIRNHVSPLDPNNIDQYVTVKSSGNAEGTFENVEFFNLKNPDYEAGAIQLNNPSKYTFKNCIFDGCQGKNGSVLYVKMTNENVNADITMDGCTIKNGTTTNYYSGIHTYVTKSSSTLKLNLYRNTFYNNISGQGSCVHLRGVNTEATLVNNTFAYNRAPVVYIGTGGIKDLTFVNNLCFESNKANGNPNDDIDLTNGVSGTVIFQNNVIDKWATSKSGGITPDATNLLNVTESELDMPTELVDNKMRLSENSIALDAGKLYSPITDGFEGTTPDAGAYEYPKTFQVKDYVNSDLSNWYTGIRTLIADAQTYGATGKTAVIEFEKDKVYNVPTDTTHLHLMPFYEAENIYIDGNGATIAAHPSNYIMTIWRCENIEISNLYMDYNPIPFTQGEVLAVDTVNFTIDFSIEAGYDTPFLDSLYSREIGQSNVTFYSANNDFLHQWVHVNDVQDNQDGTYTMNVDSLTNNAENLYLTEAGQQLVIKTLDKYHYVDSSWSDKTSTGAVKEIRAGSIGIRQSKGITLKDIRSYSSIRQTYHVIGSKDVTLERCTIERKPNTTRLIAGLKGGAIFRSSLGGIYVKDCSFEACADDLMNFEDKALLVHQILSDTKIVLNTVNDQANLLDGIGWTLEVTDTIPVTKGTVKIASVSKLSEDFLYEVEFEDISLGDYELGLGDRLFIQKASPLVVENTTFQNSLKKGIISHGQVNVLDSYFDNLNYGIHSNQRPSKNNGPIPHNQIITGNTFKDIGIGGIVCFYSYQTSNFDQQYVIKNNTFNQAAEGYGIKLDKINGAAIHNNTFTFDALVPEEYRAIYIDQSIDSTVNVSILNNTGDRLDSFTGIKSVTYYDAYTHSNSNQHTVGTNKTFSAPTRTGYIFDGWYTGELYTTKVTSTNDFQPSTDVALYAKWIPDTGARFAATSLNLLEEKPYLIQKAGIQITGDEKVICNVVIMDMLGKVLLNKVTDKSFIPYSFDNDKLYIIRMNGKSNKVIFR